MSVFDLQTLSSILHEKMSGVSAFPLVFNEKEQDLEIDWDGFTSESPFNGQMLINNDKLLITTANGNTVRFDLKHLADGTHGTTYLIYIEETPIVLKVQKAVPDNKTGRLVNFNQNAIFLAPCLLESVSMFCIQKYFEYMSHFPRVFGSYIVTELSKNGDLVKIALTFEEYIPGTTLRNILERVDDEKLSWKQRFAKEERGFELKREAMILSRKINSFETGVIRIELASSSEDNIMVSGESDITFVDHGETVVIFNREGLSLWQEIRPAYEY